MSTAKRELELIQQCDDFDKVLGVARRLGKRIGVTIYYGDSKLHFEAIVDSDTGATQVMGMTAYDT